MAKNFVVWLVFAAMFSCDISNAALGLVERDIRAPLLLQKQGFEERFSFVFDEPLAAAEFASLQPQIPLDHLQVRGSQVDVLLLRKTVPGQPYLLRGSVSDRSGNAQYFLARVYGQNLNPARLLINEFNPEGGKSSKAPEVVEFYAVQGGNIGGLTFAVGTAEENRGSFVFPPLDIATGDYILLHTRWDAERPDDIRRIDETQSQAQAQARLSSDQAWDFWADEIAGLSDTNSAIALYDSPQGELMDAVIYSTSATEVRYRGWKTSYLLRQVDRLAAAGGWHRLKNSASAEPLVPEDALRSVNSSDTRSLSRLQTGTPPIPVDSNSAADWIVVPPKKNSFGTANYRPPNYGQNLNPARLLINEFNPEGSKSSNSPEVVEFYAVQGGNIGGLTFVVGTAAEDRGSFVFPPLDVAAGDYILLHTRWDPKHPGDVRRIDETRSKTQAQARLSSDQAWDFWADEIAGLSDTNSAIALYDSPKGQLMDAVIYSTSTAAVRYRGWKSSYLLRQVDRLAAAGGWHSPKNSANTGLLVPEDAVRSKDSSSTRSLSRLHTGSPPIPVDSNSAADWIVVPTKKYSFGAPNYLVAYHKRP